MISWLSRFGNGPTAPSALLLLMLFLWWQASRSQWIPSYLLPAPTAVGQALLDSVRSGLLPKHLAATVLAATSGFALGVTAALGLATLFILSRWTERFLLAPLTVLQAIPKVALAPLLFVWIGIGLPATVVLVSMACFYPVFAGTMTGLRVVDGTLLDLYRSMQASPWRTLWDVQLPSAGPFIFNGLQVSAVFALIAAVVMEFVASNQGVGYLIQDTANSLDLPLSFACLAAITATGIAASRLIVLARKTLLFWDPSVRGSDQ